MTGDRDLDRELVAWFDERATQRIPEGLLARSLKRVDATRQRPGWIVTDQRATRGQRRFRSLPAVVQLAAAAVVGAIAIGGTFYLYQRGLPAVGTVAPTPAESLVPTTQAASPTPAASPSALLSVGRQIHTATALADGRVLIAGGYDTVNGALASTDLYDPATGLFTPTGPMAALRGLQTATLLEDGRVLIAGGGPASWIGRNGRYLASAELYDPATGTFSPTAGSMTTPREDHTATLLADGRVLIAGGNDMDNHAVASAEVYNPVAGTFTPTGSLTTPRGFHTATLLADGRVLIAGGDLAAWADDGPFLATAEIYDPTTGVFTATGSMTEGRFGQTATLLSDGQVLVAGGIPGQSGGRESGSRSHVSAELYDPKAGTFSPTGSMADGRVYHTATLLDDGRVLVAGGCDNGRVYADCRFLASAEAYDPKAGTFDATGSMTEARVYHTATLLPDGRVLAAAGQGALSPLRDAEIYDPSTGAFTLVGQSP